MSPRQSWYKQPMSMVSISKALSKIAIDTIGKDNVVSVNVKPQDDFMGGVTLDIQIELRPDAPDVSGQIYLDILFKARKYLAKHNDDRRPSISIERKSLKPHRVMKS